MVMIKRNPEGVTRYALLAICRPFRALFLSQWWTGVAPPSVIWQSFGLLDCPYVVCLCGLRLATLSVQYSWRTRWDVCRFARNLLFILWGVTPTYVSVPIMSHICSQRTSACLPGSKLRRSLSYWFSICFHSFSLSQRENEWKTIE